MSDAGNDALSTLSFAAWLEWSNWMREVFERERQLVKAAHVALEEHVKEDLMRCGAGKPKELFLDFKAGSRA